jgi:hypothetical protein
VLLPAVSRHDPVLAARVFRKLSGVKPIVSVVFNPERTSLRLSSLFRAAAHSEIDSVRADEIDHCMDDGSIEEVVAAATISNQLGWLDQYVDSAVASKHPARQARALTIAGFRDASDQSVTLLTKCSWGTGFLGAAARAAKQAYERNEWARRWREIAASATMPANYWCNVQLMTDAADWRYSLWFGALGSEDGVASSLWFQFAPLAWRRLEARAQEKRKKRTDQLFGARRPADDLILSIRAGRG